MLKLGRTCLSVDRPKPACRQTGLPMLRTIFLIILFLSGYVSLKAQCSQNRNADWNNAIAVINSPTLKLPEKIDTLKRWLGKINSCVYKNDSVNVLVLKLIGEAYSYQLDFVNAAKYYGQAIDMLNANAGKPAINSEHLINTYFWLSTFYDSLNNTVEKMKAVNKCIEVSGRLKRDSNISCVRSYYELVKYLFDIGDYKACIDNASMCETLALKYISKSDNYYDTYKAQSIIASALGWKINALLKLRKYDTAEQLQLSKEKEYREKNMGAYLGHIYTLFAEMQTHKEDYGKAISSYKKALKFALQNKYTYSAKQILNAMGSEVYFKKLKDYDKALYHFREAMKYLNPGDTDPDNLFENLNIYANIGNVYLSKGLYDSAFRYFQLGFDAVRPGMNETHLLQMSAREISGFKKLHYLSNLLIGKANVYSEKFKRNGDKKTATEALNIYKIVDQLFDRLKFEQTALESKLYWRSDSRQLYESAIAVCYLTGNTSEAFYFFEKSRAVLLSDQLAMHYWLNEEDISLQMQLRKKISKLQAEGKSESQAEIFTYTRQLDSLEARIKIHNPLYYQGLERNYTKLADMQKSLAADQQSLLEIFSGDSAVYTLTVTADRAYLNRINKKDYEEAVIAYNRYIADARLLNSDFNGFRNASHQLYKLIFTNTPVPAGRIIISPAGRYFPFESLITNNTSKDPVYFLVDHAVSYTYSARYLLNNFSNGGSSLAGNFLGIAPVEYPGSFSLLPLTGSDRSLQAIKSYFNSTDLLIAKEASRNNFLRQFYGYKIIQLYTHASDSSFRNEPVIYFADSALYLSELSLENKPATRLLVLSACETGSGQVYQGEGVFSFNRGFAAMGIPSCIANLWSVDNLSTYRLTEAFYKYLAKGLTIDVALQKAKLDLLQSGENKLPYYWAATVLVGETDVVETKKPFPWKGFLVSVVVVVLIAGIYFFKRKK